MQRRGHAVTAGRAVLIREMFFGFANRASL
jgi:hypothetical protein